MAIDTKEKRLSMINFGDGALEHLLFEADGAVDLDDRQHLLGCYGGVAFAPPTFGGPVTGSLALMGIGK